MIKCRWQRVKEIVAMYLIIHRNPCYSCIDECFTWVSFVFRPFVTLWFWLFGLSSKVGDLLCNGFSLDLNTILVAWCNPFFNVIWCKMSTKSCHAWVYTEWVSTAMTSCGTFLSVGVVSILFSHNGELFTAYLQKVHHFLLFSSKNGATSLALWPSQFPAGPDFAGWLVLCGPKWGDWAGVSQVLHLDQQDDRFLGLLWDWGVSKTSTKFSGEAGVQGCALFASDGELS